MSTGWTKCQHNRQHRTQAEAAACPGCLIVLAAPTRRRRNAVVATMLPGTPEPDQDAASSASCETLSSTPQSSRAVTPANIEKSTTATYPTPSCSQNNHMQHRGAVSQSPGSPLGTTFTTAQSESPAPPPPSPASENSVQYTYDLLGNLETTRLHQTAPPNTLATPPPPLSPPAPMAPRKLHNTRSSARASPIQTPAAVALALTEDADIPVPSIEPADPDYPQQQEEELDTLRTSRNDLKRQLQASTALVERLRTRANIADAERDRAVVQRNEAQTALEILRQDKGTAAAGGNRCRLRRCVMQLKAVVAIVALYLVWRLVVFAPEFEYIARRREEVFGESGY